MDILLFAQDPPGWPQYVTWIIGGIGLITGGLGGAALTAFITNRRNRVQPVHYGLQIDSLFEMPEDERLVATIAVETPDGSLKKYSNLWLAKITIENTGNQDLEEIKLGITLANKGSIIWADGDGSDQYHKVTSALPKLPHSQNKTCEFTCSPFNRGNEYFLKSYVNLLGGEKLRHSDFRFATPASVRLTQQQKSGVVIVPAQALIWYGFIMTFFALTMTLTSVISSWLFLKK